MCTVVIWSRGEGWVMAGNRDEMVVRGEAMGPREVELEGVRVLAPRDPDGGGSWVAVNEYGVGVTLLNAYQADAELGREVEDPISRGLLVMGLAGVRSLGELRARVEAVELGRYRPFVLLGVEPGEAGAQAWGFWWLGGELKAERLELPHVEISSSVRIEEARENRGRVLGLMIEGEAPGFEVARGMFASHEPERGPLSVCMHREDARTRSHSFVSVGRDWVEFSYVGGAPCGELREERFELLRAGSVK